MKHHIAIVVVTVCWATSSLSRAELFTAPFGPGGTWNLYETLPPASFADAWRLEQAGRLDPLIGGIPGHLVDIHSSAENEYVLAIAGGSRAIIGLTDREGAAPGAREASTSRTQGWAWTSGAPFTYSNWSVGEPLDFFTGEDAVSLYGNGTWNDLRSGFAADEPIVPVVRPGTSAPELGLRAAVVLEYEFNSFLPIGGADFVFPERPPLIPHDGPPLGPRGGHGFFGARTLHATNTMPIFGEATLRSVGDAIRQLSLQNGPITDGQTPVINHGDPQRPGILGVVGNPLPLIGNLPGDDDNVAVVYHGHFFVPVAGEYTFNVHTDDGFALQLPGNQFTSSSGNGEIVPGQTDTLAHTRPSANTDTRGVVNLAEGIHPVRFVAFEAAGHASWEVSTAIGAHQHNRGAQWLLLGDSSVRAEIPPPATAVRLTSPALAINGADANNISGARAAIANALVDPQSPRSLVNDVVLGDSFGCCGHLTAESFPNLGGDEFSTGVFGQILVDDGDATPGEPLTLTFALRSDDGSQLRILGQDFLAAAGSQTTQLLSVSGDMALTADFFTPNTDATGLIELVEGTYDFEAFHYEGRGGAGLSIWVAPGDHVGAFDDSVFLPLGVHAPVPANIGLRVVAEPPRENEWLPLNNGVWSSSLNWNADRAPNSGEAAYLGSQVTADATVTLDTDVTLQRLTFDNDWYSYSIDDNGEHALTFAAGGVIDVRAGSHEIATRITGIQGFTKSGNGALTLSGTKSFEGSTVVADGTLTVENSRLTGHSIVVDRSAVLDVSSFAQYTLGVSQTLSGSGTVVADNIVISPSAALRGALLVQGNVINQGLLAPGFSPEITNIDGDFTQLADGTLEIEVGGLSPGDEHDQVIVSGVANLSGRLDIPLIDDFVPVDGDEVVFLTANEAVLGAFDAVSSPNLAQNSPNLALEIIQGEVDVRIRYSNITEIQFDGLTPANNWNDINTWSTGAVPIGTDVIALENLIGEPQEVDLVAGNAFVHDLALSGDVAPIQLRVVQGSNLSATAGVAIGELGSVVLQNGRVVTNRMEIQSGGTLSGVGTVVGDLTVGSTEGDLAATLRPGAGPAAGRLEVQGNFAQTTNGTTVLQVDEENPGQIDTLVVSGQAEFGGTLRMVVTDDTPLGVNVRVISAGDVVDGSVFDRIETVGVQGVYFAPNYIGSEVVPRGSFGRGLGGQFCRRGDFVPCAVLDENDIRNFALGLRDPEAFSRLHFIEANEAADVDFDGDLDFDDIDEFASLFPNLSAAQVWALMHVPEPSSGFALMLSALLLAASRARGGHVHS